MSGAAPALRGRRAPWRQTSRCTMRGQERAGPERNAERGENQAARAEGALPDGGGGRGRPLWRGDMRAETRMQWERGVLGTCRALRAERTGGAEAPGGAGLAQSRGQRARGWPRRRAAGRCVSSTGSAGTSGARGGGIGRSRQDTSGREGGRRDRVLSAKGLRPGRGRRSERSDAGCTLKAALGSVSRWGAGGSHGGGRKGHSVPPR